MSVPLPKPDGDPEPEHIQSTSGRSFMPWFVWLPALILFYILSVGPAVWLFKRTPNQSTKKFLVAVYVPLQWAAEHTPLEKVLNPYVKWWGKRAAK